jgi:ATPase subunit of ABC transporter with duplicated ATPase domains
MAQLSFKRQKKKAKTEYTDLAPIDEITSGDEYLNALEWALSNERVKNIALAGPYGAGKSSIIETYLKQHPTVKEKSLRISMATFAENAVNEDETPKKVNIGQDEIELGILKQLFYKVDYKKIPQSRYRRLHKIRWKHIWGCLIGLSTIISLMEYIFFPEVFYSSII